MEEAGAIEEGVAFAVVWEVGRRGGGGGRGGGRGFLAALKGGWVVEQEGGYCLRGGLGDRGRKRGRMGCFSCWWEGGREGGRKKSV